MHARVELQLASWQHVWPGPPHASHVGVGESNVWQSPPVAQRGESSQHGWPGWPQPAMHVPAAHTPVAHAGPFAQHASPCPPHVGVQ